MMQSSGETRRENEDACFLGCHAPRKRGHPVFQRLLGKSSKGSGILDRPVKPDDDTE